MPAKCEFPTQSEMGVLRHCDVAVGRGSAGGVRPATGVRRAGAQRPARGSCENSKFIVGTGANGRKSPRLGVGSAASHSSGSARPRLGLTDITNVATGRALDKAKISKPIQPLLPLDPTTSNASQAIAQAPALEERTEERPAEAKVVNVQSVEEYVDDIHGQFFAEESTFLPRADYMELQTDISAKMRMILIDWLVEVHMKYRLRDETLYLTVNLIDRYLTKVPVVRKRLQLVGVVAMFIASKFEEISPPELHDWVYITDNAYTKEDILSMECSMLCALSFQIMVPTACNFFEFLQEANGCSGVHRHAAQYLLELGLLDIRMLQYTPSHAVSAALLLSNELLKRATVWPDQMVEKSHYTEEQLSGCVEDLRQMLQVTRATSPGSVKDLGQLQAIYKKFSVTQRHAVAKLMF